MESSSTSSKSPTWIQLHCRKRGNKYLCEIDESYIEDSFNLFGLRSSVSHYSNAINLILDDSDGDITLEEQYLKINHSAERLYGYIHARYIITSRGLSRMCQKYQRGDFGHCSQISCGHHPLLPFGVTDVFKQEKMRLLCPNCEETTTSEQATLDGAYFGTSWIQMLFMAFPELRPCNYPTKYIPKVFGYRIHPSGWISQKPAKGRTGKGEAGSIIRTTMRDINKNEDNRKLIDEFRKGEKQGNVRVNGVKIDL